MSELFLNAPENELIVESHPQNDKQSHFVLVKRPELSRKDKNIQTKVTSLFGKCDEEKVQVFVFKCREEKRKIYLSIVTKYLYLTSQLCQFPIAGVNMGRCSPQESVETKHGAKKD